MDTLAVVLEEPERLSLRRLELQEAAPDDVVVRIDWSGISTGTERLLWTGRMPPFPGMGYPLVPGYESVGTVIDAGANVRDRIGRRIAALGDRVARGGRQGDQNASLTQGIGNRNDSRAWRHHLSRRAAEEAPGVLETR